MEEFFLMIYLSVVLTLIIVIIIFGENIELKWTGWFNKDRKLNKDSSTSNYIPASRMIPHINIPTYYKKPNVTRNRLYSEISQRLVLPCCYNAARLNDRYCVCGRAVIYP